MVQCRLSRLRRPTPIVVMRLALRRCCCCLRFDRAYPGAALRSLPLAGVTRHFRSTKLTSLASCSTASCRRGKHHFAFQSHSAIARRNPCRPAGRARGERAVLAVPPDGALPGVHRRGVVASRECATPDQVDASGHDGAPLASLAARAPLWQCRVAVAVFRSAARGVPRAARAWCHGRTVRAERAPAISRCRGATGQDHGASSGGAARAARGGGTMAGTGARWPNASTPGAWQAHRSRDALLHCVSQSAPPGPGTGSPVSAGCRHGHRLTVIAADSPVGWPVDGDASLQARGWRGRQPASAGSAAAATGVRLSDAFPRSEANECP